MAPPKPLPARIHVLLAREAPRALVIRKGPAKSVATILWNRRNNEFQLGQWMRGRIYERRCDLSPDGKYFIYFAMNGKWQSEAKGAWTAISNVPYLKAITLMPKGNCWNGGGLFLDNRRYWLNDGQLPHETLLASSAVEREPNFEPEIYFGGECLGVYYPRLLRDGWSMRDQLESEDHDWVVAFEKSLTKGWLLRKFAHAGRSKSPGQGVYWDEHELENANLNLHLKFPKWEWAEWVDNRLAWATGGQLWSAKLKTAGLYDERLLHDFNAMKFEAIPAPY